jgi:hypothetical protein
MGVVAVFLTVSAVLWRFISLSAGSPTIFQWGSAAFARLALAFLAISRSSFQIKGIIP